MILVCMYGLIHLLGVHFEVNELPLLLCVHRTFDSVAVTKSVPIHTLHVIILLQYTLSVACHSLGNQSALPIQALGSVQIPL